MVTALSTVLLVTGGTGLAYADEEGMTCVDKCIRSVYVSVKGEADYIASMTGEVGILGPPTISKARLHVRFLNYNNQILVEKWASAKESVKGKFRESWPVGARFGPGRVCATAYEGTNQIATACVDIKS